MADEAPLRLNRPFPKAKSAKTPFGEALNFVDGNQIEVRFIPIVQWGAIRIRGRIDSDAGVIGLEFARPSRQKDVDDLPNALVYGAGQPAVNGFAWVDDVEFVLDITAAEHVGENWLKITLDPAGGADIVFFDVSGENLGQGS